MALHVYNTLARTKEPFVTRQPGIVRIYTCGLTVYAPMHSGHARTYCFWDLFRRYLEYLGYHVVSVINYTDIDDRIMAKAGAAPGGAGCVDVAETNIAAFRRDCRSLRIKDYAVYTRATDFLREQIDMVDALVRAGHAYPVDGEVFYDVASFPAYGALSGRTVEEQQAGASGRVEEDFARKRHPADFTLWKPSQPDQPAWPTGRTDWPQGRPGWHIECSAMGTALLGARLDVHGGAVDNMFPHHENEIAQSEPLCGSPWVRYWLHPAHLDLSGVKMSKSLGNVIGVPELIGRHRYDTVRWFFAMNHYRSKLAFSDELLDSAGEGYGRVVKLLRVLEASLLQKEDAALEVPARGLYMSQRADEERVPRLRHHYTHGRFGEISARYMARFREALDDDLSTPRATAATFDYVGELYKAGIENETAVPDVLAAYRCLARHLYVLGCEHVSERLYPHLAAECMSAGVDAADAADAAAPLRGVIDQLLEQRQQARKARDFARGDLIRDLLGAAGVLIEDTAGGPRWSLKARRG